MGFPDTFVFKGSKTDIARQIGNAVPPDLAGAIGKMVKATLATKPAVKPARAKRKATEAEIAETVSA
jgi:DNA (cytosine-5)-methyltransferase 1